MYINTIHCAQDYELYVWLQAKESDRQIVPAKLQQQQRLPPPPKTVIQVDVL